MILGIESSCDESALAVFSPEHGIAGEWISSQIDLHREYGGVVPDLASREHLRNFPTLCAALKREIGWDRITRLAVTNGPGLAGCLALGISLAKSLSVARGLPITGINHLRGHAFSPFIDLHQQDPAGFFDHVRELTPHLGLLVSGGNTLLFSLDARGAIRLVAETVDDAAGEALDKGAKLLGLGYPGGPAIERIAREGDPASHEFPRAFPRRGELKFSFSGLKTSLRYRLEKLRDDQLNQTMGDLCASYQEAVIDALVRKTEQALEEGDFKSVGLSGGVSNNTRLREGFATMAARRNVALFRARPEHTGDNAGMIAFAAYADPRNGEAEQGEALAFHPSRALVIP